MHSKNTPPPPNFTHTHKRNRSIVRCRWMTVVTKLTWGTSGGSIFWIHGVHVKAQMYGSSATVAHTNQLLTHRRGDCWVHTIQRLLDYHTSNHAPHPHPPPLPLQWVTADPEIKEPSAENPELSKVLSLKPGVDRIKPRMIHVLPEMSPMYFLHSWYTQLYFFQILSPVLLALLMLFGRPEVTLCGLQSFFFLFNWFCI